MALAGTAAITELWAKCKAWFGTKVTSSTTATTASIQLKNSADNALGSAATISAATTTAAGVMTADDRTKLNGIATGATANAATTTTPKMDGTAAVGTETAYAKGDHVHPTDTSRAASSHSHGDITNGGDITATAPTVASGDKIIINDESASKVTNGPSFGTSTTTYLRNDGTWGTPAGTANQNAFSNVKVGSTTIEAENTTDTLELAAGSNITLTPDAINDKVTIAATDTTYSDATTSTHGLMSTADKTKLNYLRASAVIPHGTCSTAAGTAAKAATLDNSDAFTLAAGAVVAVTFTNSNTAANPTLNVNSTGAKSIYFYGTQKIAAAYSWDAYETVFFTYNGTGWMFEGSGKAIAKVAVDLDDTPPKIHSSSSTTYGSGTSSNYGHVKLSDATDGTSTAASGATAATPKAVSDALAAAKSYADGLVTGSTQFKGTVAANSTISDSAYKAGWYWVVSAAGTYVGQACEVGDMVFAIANKGSSYSESDFSVVQNNIVEMTAAEVDAICV